MSFKILAIRHLEKNANLKNLKPDYLYPFYTNYKFLDKNGESIVDCQYNESQPLYRFIADIECTNEITNEIFGNFISICAIVGKNGSGKSTLLELIYLYLYNISVYYDVIKLPPDNIKEDNYQYLILELYVELDGVFYEIRHISSGSLSNKIYRLSDKKWIEVVDSRDVKALMFWFYSIVLNYSIYGLNSKVLGNWIGKIFHKNDGYQTPIVINPYRDDGIININIEYLLAQSRLILFYYQISKDKRVIDDISIDSVDFEINSTKHQYVHSDVGQNKEKTINVLRNFLDYLDVGIDDIIEWIFGVTHDPESYDLRNTILQLSNYINNVSYEDEIGRFDEGNEVNDVKYLCFLYVFKKLKRIAENYSKYREYSFLFHSNASLSAMFEQEFNSDSRLGDLMDEMIKTDKQDISSTVKEYLLAKTIAITKQVLGKEYNGFDLISGDRLYAEIEMLLTSPIDNEGPNFDFKKQFFNRISLYVEKELSGNIPSIFVNYMKELSEDDSHITFKLKQAINYFKNKTFNSFYIGGEKTEIDRNGNKNFKTRIYIDNDLFNEADITNIPLAFFDPQIYVKKEGDEPFLFNFLSSGEQQMIHTILSVNYHIYNLLSVEKNNEDNILYTNVNLIFDEIELYFHPEYQRKFIDTLITNLKRFQEREAGIYFNVIFSTHSPFILSDIPTQNILKLKEGVGVKRDDINSFGANIHDLLADEFFLDQGNIGEFASNKINQLYALINDDSPKDLKDYYHLLKQINLIGEPVLRNPLLKLLDEKFMTILEKDRLIEFHKRELEKLISQ